MDKERLWTKNDYGPRTIMDKERRFFLVPSFPGNPFNHIVDF